MCYLSQTIIDKVTGQVFARLSYINYRIFMQVQRPPEGIKRSMVNLDEWNSYNQ